MLTALEVIIGIQVSSFGLSWPFLKLFQYYLDIFHYVKSKVNKILTLGSCEITSKTDSKLFTEVLFSSFRWKGGRLI